tara:strand:+ start:942 stop:1793 length:852 start_codon:yes stop_codon:yes gene_type:complete
MCYREEILWFDNPLFSEDVVPVSYLLTMENSSRRASYMQQLADFRPTKKVIILHNKGWKRCEKPTWVTNSSADLWHANLEVANRASGCVLLLEDDVQFLPHVRQDVTRVETLLREKRDETFFYTLGTRFMHSVMMNNSTQHHLRVIFGADAHAIIYNNIKALQDLDVPNGQLHDFCVYNQMDGYTFERPLAIQYAETTENSTHWNLWGIPILLIKTIGDEELFWLVHGLGKYGGIAPAVVMLLLLLYLLSSKSKTLSSIILSLLIIYVIAAIPALLKTLNRPS